MSLESEMQRLTIAKQNFAIALEYHNETVESDDLFSDYPDKLNHIPFMIEPDEVDYNYGYIDGNGWHYENNGGRAKNPIDIYKIQQDHSYFIVLGATVGSRFRVCTVSEEDDIRNKTSGIWKAQALNNENAPKTAYAVMGGYKNPNYGSSSCPFFTSTVDGYLLIQKDNNYTLGLKTYVFDLDTPIDVLNGPSSENLLDESLFDIVNGVITLKSSVDKTELTGRKIVPDTVNGQTVTGIGADCFADCDQLATIELPSTVTSIGDRAFINNATINVNRIHSNITTLGDYVYQNNLGLREATIPATVTSLGVGTFKGCNKLSTMTFKGNVTTLNGTFEGCSNLQSLQSPSIPENVTTLGPNTFKGTKLSSLPTMNGVTSYGTSVFENCTNLGSASIPSRITSIGANCFKGCTSLTYVHMWADVPPTLVDSNAFDNTNNCPIYVPDEVVTDYQSATNWSALAARITGISNKPD